MRICTSCKSELPDNTRFCGQCGQRFASLEEPSTGNSITRSSDIHSFDQQRTLADGNITYISANDEGKTIISSHHKIPETPNVPIPDVRNDEDIEHEILHSFDGWDEENAITAPLANATGTKKDDDEEERKDVLLPFPFMPNNAPPPTPGNILAQGPLHIDQVPYGGHPHFPGPAQPTPMTPPATPHPAQLFQAAPSRLSAVVSPTRGYNPFKRHQTPSQHHNPAKRHPIRPPCLVVVVVAFLGICILAIIFITHLSNTHSHLTPVAKLVGVPIPGQKIILHGGSFDPGETVTVVIDKQPTASNASFLSNTLNMQGLFSQKTITPTGIKEIVNADGTFSLTITVDPSWPVGSVHTLYVYKQDGTIIKLPPFVVVNPTTPTQGGLQNCLDETGIIKLGPVQEGSTATISKTVTLCTQATNPVKWTAQSNQKWLQIPSSGQVHAPGGNLSIKASAKGLHAGAYDTTILFNSPQNTAPVTLNVVLVVIKAPPASPPSSTQPNSPPQVVTCVGVTPQVISFTNVANQYTLLSKNVNINNCGSDGKWSASITNTSGKPWLSVGPAQGPIPSGWFQGVAITASSAALSPGSYSSKVTFHIGSSSADLTVMFTVNPPQTPISCIDASPQLLTFSGIAGQNDVQARRLKLSNCGVAGQWSLSTQTDNGSGWLQASMYSHALKIGEAQEITITASSAYLNQGVHYAQLIVSMGSSTVRVIVLFEVRDTCFKVDYRSLLFKIHVGDSPVQVPLTLTNCSSQGTETVSWYGSASTDDGANWLNLDRDSGQLAAHSSQQVYVDVFGAKLHGGIYTGNVLFIMGSHKITVRVKLIVVDTTPIANNCIRTNTDSLSFFSYQFSNPDPQEVDVENCGNTTEEWTVTSSQDWIHPVPLKGKLGIGDEQDVYIRLSSEHLSAGDHTGTLTFRSGSSIKQVTIYLRIAPQPCIIVAPTSLTFSSMIAGGQSSRPDAQTVKVTNCGGAGSLSTSNTTNDGASWLGVTPPTDHLDVGQVINVPIAVDSSGLAPGSYSASIPFTITVQGGAQATAYVNVSFSIAQKPVPCTANPSTLNFVSDWGQPTPPLQSVTLSGCGPNATWTETDSSDRLFYVDPDSGTFDSNNGGSQVVRIGPDRRPSVTGAYTYILTFASSSGKMATVTATWTINPPSNPTCIQPDSAPLSFSDQDENTSGNVSFSNCGAYPGNITVNADSSWLTISAGGSAAIDGSSTFATGSGPNVAANANSTNLTPGRYNGTIKATINTPQGSQSASINVVYIVPLPVVPPTPTPIVAPTDTPTDTPGITPSDTSGVTPTDTSTSSTGGTPTDTPGSTPTDTPGITPTDTSVVTPTPTPCMVIPTDTPGITPTPIPCYTPTDTPGVTPTDTPGVTPTDTPGVTPTDTPIPTPTDTPVPVPTDTPIPTPTDTPVPTPTDTPIPTPTDTPIPTPTDTPTPVPTDTPTPGP